MVTSVIELSDKLYKKYKATFAPLNEVSNTFRLCQDVQTCERAITLSKVCANANDIGLPLSVVEQLLKDTDYEQLLS